MPGFQRSPSCHTTHVVTSQKPCYHRSQQVNALPIPKQHTRKHHHRQIIGHDCVVKSQRCSITTVGQSLQPILNSRNSSANEPHLNFSSADTPQESTCLSRTSYAWSKSSAIAYLTTVCEHHRKFSLLSTHEPKTLQTRVLLQPKHN